MTIDERLSKSREVLDDYEQSCNLPPKIASNEVQRYIQMPVSELMKLSPQESGVAAILLFRHAEFLQRKASEECSSMKCAEELVKQIIAPTVSEQKGYGFEEKKLNAIYSDEAAVKADQARIKAMLRFERLQYLSRVVADQARAFMNLNRGMK